MRKKFFYLVMGLMALVLAGCNDSPSLKRIFHATKSFPYTNNAHLGSKAAPYTPEWVIKN